MKIFIERLEEAWKVNDSLVCVGLDPEPERFPRHIAAMSAPIFEFNRAIIDATADLVWGRVRHFISPDVPARVGCPHLKEICGRVPSGCPAALRDAPSR